MEIMKGLILSIFMQPNFSFSFMDVVEQLLHIHCHCFTLSIFFKLCSCLSPASHPFMSPSPYILLLWFTSSTLCNK
jgi:hypothetical protein